MKVPSSRTVGASSTTARSRSFSRNRVRGGAGWDVRGWGRATSSPAAPPAPPAMGFFKWPLSVDLLQLTLGPLHGVLGLHALHGLGVHVHDDVLGERLGRLPARRTAVPEDAGVARGRAEHLEGLVDLVPHGVLVPRGRRRDAVALAHLEPLLEVLLLVEPGEEVLRELRVLRVLHDAVAVGEIQGVHAGAARERIERVVDVLPHRLALLVLDLVLLALGDDVDGRAVEAGGDVARVEGAVVVRVVPGEPALVATLLPQRRHVLHRVDGALAVDHDLLAGGVSLRAAERPEQGVRPGRRVAEGVAERLAVGLALLLERGGRLAQLVPRPGEPVEADLLEPDRKST